MRIFLGKNTGAAEGKRESRALEEHFEEQGVRGGVVRARAWNGVIMTVT